MKKVMISSTVLDLPEHRKEVLEACLRQGFFPVMMEHLTTADTNAKAKSLAMVDEADIYLGILGYRYGYVPEDDNPGRISITEMEYNRAAERGIPRLIFFMDKAHSLTAADMEEDTKDPVESARRKVKLEELKTWAGKDRVVGSFKSAMELRALVIQTLTEHRDETEQDGITKVLLDWNDGDSTALERLMPMVEAELRRIAHLHMRNEGIDHTLQTTALVNETYLKLVDERKANWQGRAHFYGIAAKVMRRILIDHAFRRRRARGGGEKDLPLDEAIQMLDEKSAELLALDEALDKLASMDPLKSQIVELRHFGGFSIEETAEFLKIEPITVIRHWKYARAWLKRAVRPDNPPTQDLQKGSVVESLNSTSGKLSLDERQSFTAKLPTGQESLGHDVNSSAHSDESLETFIEEPVFSLGLRALRQPQEDLSGTTIDRYQLISRLGSGGMGDVYKAHDPRLNRVVAIKLLNSAIVNDEQSLRRFEQEGRTASAISHPNVAIVYEVNEFDGRQFIVMEYVPGPTLRQVMKRGPVETAQVVDIISQVLSALIAAGQAGVIHRDIKPENIIVADDGLVKVLDFGLAKFVQPQKENDRPTDESTTIHTKPELLMGTSHYMSPEQVRRGPIDIRADLWSVGVVLYEMLCEQRPFPGHDFAEVMVSVLEQPPLPFSFAKRPVSTELQELAFKALSKSPNDRFQSAGEMLAALRETFASLELTDERKLYELEGEAVELLRQGQFEQSRESFADLILNKPSLKERINEEFGFAFSSVGEAGLGMDRVRDQSQGFLWRWRIWKALAAKNPLPTFESQEYQPIEIFDEVNKAAEHQILASGGSPEVKGEMLEHATMRLFRTFFDLGEDVPWKKIRKQKRGTQGGHDLSIEWSWSGKYNVVSKQNVRCHIECKNYEQQVTLREVGEKLLSEPQRNAVIEHWILISPRANPSNELNRFLEEQHKEGRFPFDIQIWSPETGVAEFFGLEPDVYDYFFTPAVGETHPRNWDDRRRQEVTKKWLDRLKPPQRLPAGWFEYIHDPRKLCSPPEDGAKLGLVFERHVPMRCRNTAGTLLEKPLRAYIDEWLEQDGKPVLLLLGEFGDGKTFFTYTLARQLAVEWVENRERGWIPLRLTLRKYPGNAREFLRQRLEEFSADVGSWSELGKEARRLVILDGFDEMSVRLDPSMMTKNIGDLLECVKEMEGCKILITSRTHFFENRQDSKRLLARLNNPMIYHLAPIERPEVSHHLENTVSSENSQILLARIQRMNDPIGLAGKPLFLEMLGDILNEPNLPINMDVHHLYEQYIERALSRKIEYLDDPGYHDDPQATIRNLRQILGAIAEELQRTGSNSVSLGKFEKQLGGELASLLWQISGSSELNDDARNRVGARSLLARIVSTDIAEEWPVDFCHRSMREYFVAQRLCEAVETSEEQGARFLKEVPLNHEIVLFAAENWKRKKLTPIQNRLLSLLRYAKNQTTDGQVAASALTILYRLNPQLPRNFDWTELVLDGVDLEEADLSGMDFRGCSFRHANLSNVNFENANFENSDFTGVRLEETKPVVSLAVAPGLHKVFTLYGDGVLREWHIPYGTRATSRTITTMPIAQDNVLGLHDSGEMWLKSRHEWMFLGSIDEDLRPQGKFVLRNDVGHFVSKANSIIFRNSVGNGEAQLNLLDMEASTTVFTARVKHSGWCGALGNQAFVWSNGKNGLTVGNSLTEAQDLSIDLLMPEPTCVEIYDCGSQIYHVAAGDSVGVVRVWRIDLKEWPFASANIVERSIHTGPVTAIAFMGHFHVVSGGADRAVVLNTIDPGAQDVPTVRLQLTLRCKGMNIQGLKSPKEYELLSKYIQNAL